MLHQIYREADPLKVNPVKVKKESVQSGEIKLPNTHEDWRAKAEIERKITKHFDNADIVLRSALVQSFLVIIYSAYGLMNIVGRDDYYKRMIKIFSLVLIFCAFLDGSEMIMNLLNG